MPDFHIGDKVSITGRIKYIDDDELEARVEFLFDKEGFVLSGWINLNNLIMDKQCKKLNIGDRAVSKLNAKAEFIWVGSGWYRVQDNKLLDRNHINFDDPTWHFYPRNEIEESDSKCTHSSECIHKKMPERAGGHCIFDACDNGINQCPIHPIRGEEK